MGIQHYPRAHSLNEDNAYGSLPPELTSFTSSTFEPRHSKDSKSSITANQQTSQRLLRLNENFEFANRRKIGSTDVFGQNMENLVQLEEPKLKFAKSLDEICEEMPKKQMRGNSRIEAIEKGRPHSTAARKEEQEFTKNLVRRNQSFDYAKYSRAGLDSRTYDMKGVLKNERNFEIKRDGYDQETGYETSDDESCDFDSGDFDDTMSSYKSRSRSCCSVTTVANDDFEFFQRKGTKVDLFPSKRSHETRINMRSFTPKIIDKIWTNDVDSQKKDGGQISKTKPTIQSYHLKKITPGYSMNDLDKLFPDTNHPTVSISSLKSALTKSDISYLDNGEICRHNIGGSAPDFKKIFVTEFI